jgi:hypothetical protein
MTIQYARGIMPRRVSQANSWQSSFVDSSCFVGFTGIVVYLPIAFALIELNPESAVFGHDYSLCI